MLAALRSRHKVVEFDMAPRTNQVRLLTTGWRFLIGVIFSRPRSVYLALSGGFRQWIDILYVGVARVFGIPLFIHHHTFSYFAEPRLVTKLLLRVAGNATHIVLCECMSGLLEEIHEVDSQKIRVLSNISFLDDIESTSEKKGCDNSLRVGFLSNIVAEKGIFEFFSILKESNRYGLALQGIVAGPVDASVKDKFMSSLSVSANVQYMGAVYGNEKERFFSNIDVLIFPSRLYEAEPVTVLEAMGRGVPVIAFSVGCIDSVIGETAGIVFPYSEGFISQTMEALFNLAGSPSRLSDASRAARATFLADRDKNKAVLRNLLEEISGQPISTPVSI